MPGILTAPIVSSAAPSHADKLRAYLGAFWLRPENAMWMVLRSEALRRAGCTSYDLDLGCGDGIFTFLHLGGRLSEEFDVFTSVGVVPARRNPEADMFNYIDDRYRPEVRHTADSVVTVGTDHKGALLAKASRLNLYSELLQQDHNQHLRLADESFQTVYCNTAYWVENIDAFLSEIRRITRPGGRVLLQVKLDSMLDCTLAGLGAVLGTKFLTLIDGGRSRMWPTLADRRTWEARFKHAGLAVVEANSFATETHAHLWDVGLRPVAPLLAKMANGLSPQKRGEIKREWVDLFLDLLDPLCDPKLELIPGRDEPVEIQYELTPS